MGEPATTPNNSTRRRSTVHGSKVPTFNIHDQQHHRVPFKDKGGYLNTRPHPPWQKVPAYRSQTDLMQARKSHMVPHKSYDFDGDGVVGQRDYFIGKYFDDDHDDRLNSAERAVAEKALSQGWLDKFAFGFDASGAARKNAVVQRRGLILNQDNRDEMGDTYPKHFNAGNNPAHLTKTEMLLDRRGEMVNVATKLKERYDMHHPVFVAPNPVSQEFRVEKPPIDHIHQRADAENQAARVKGGLLPVMTYENPERQRLTLGQAGGYVANPLNRTRSQLLDSRKEVHRRQIEEQVLESEQHHIPYSVRVARREAACFEFRAPKDAFTLTKLKQRRKEDRVEYDMQNFGVKPTIYPRMSDQPHPWWSLAGPHRAGSPGPERTPSAPARMPPVEPAFKVTEQEWPPAKGRAGTAPAGMQPEDQGLPGEDFRAPAKKMQGTLGANTKKRWTSELIEQGHTRNAARYFDALKPAQTYARDFEPLDNVSSFDLIREDSLAAQAKSREDGKKQSPVSKILDADLTLSQRRGVDSRQGTGMDQTMLGQRQRSAPSLGGTQESSKLGGMEGGDRSGLPSRSAMTQPAMTQPGFRGWAPGPSMMERATAAQTSASNNRPSLSRDPSGSGFGAGSSFGRRTMPPGGLGGAKKSWGVRSGGFQRLDQTRREEDRPT